MNLLFLTLSNFDSLSYRDINTDLLREFIRNRHRVYVISPLERRYGKRTYMIEKECTTILKLQIGNIQKTNLIEKGISTVTIEKTIIKGIEKYFFDIRFDMVIYNTPPITFCKAVEYVKKRDEAKSYLLLKDIFPQNAVDIGILNKRGIKGILYSYFRRKERKLYKISDYIGCMSEANVRYVLKNNPEIPVSKVEVCPNSIDAVDKSVTEEHKIRIRKKYGIPLDKTVFVYGGNLGRPQGIPFLIDCLKSQKGNGRAFFLIIGNGTEYSKLKRYVDTGNPTHVKLMDSLPKEDYDNMVGACDVGMIFLDHRFTIPNFPSRMLSYMQAKIPILAVTDPNTDIGKVIMENEFGWWCESDDVGKFGKAVEDALCSDRKILGNRAFDILLKKYGVKSAYKIIAEHIPEAIEATEIVL